MKFKSYHKLSNNNIFFSEEDKYLLQKPKLYLQSSFNEVQMNKSD